MVLAALLVALALSIAGLAVAVVRAVGLWRQLKKTGGLVSAELASFEKRAEQADRYLDEWERSSAELERAQARLRESRARLQVLLDSVERAQVRLRWLRVFLPAR